MAREEKTNKRQSLPAEFIIREENKKTGGHYQAQTFAIDIPATVGPEEKSISFPFPVSALSAEWVNKSEFVSGDEIEFLVARDTIIGAITAAVSASDVWLTVQQSVIDNTRLGACIKIDDDTNNDVMGRVIEIDAANLKIKMETAATQAFSPATPTYVKQTIELLRKGPLDSEGRVQLGESKIGGSYIPSNTQLTAIFHNSETIAKRLVFALEYLY